MEIKILMVLLPAILLIQLLIFMLKVAAVCVLTVTVLKLLFYRPRNLIRNIYIWLQHMEEAE